MIPAWEASSLPIYGDIMRKTQTLLPYCRYTGVGFLALFAACGQDVAEVPEESRSAVADTIDNGIAQADATGSFREPPAGWSTDDGLEVTIDFTGRYNPATGELTFEVEEASVPVSENGLRTTNQALWCADRLAIVQDGTPGTNPPNTLELITESLGTYADCDPSTFPDGSPSGMSYANLVDTDGALCAEISVRSFYPYGIEQVYAWIYEVNPVDNYAYTFGDRSIDGLGNGAEPPLGLNAPSDNQGGLFYYGDLNAFDPVGGVDNAISTSWVFRYPVDGAEFNFRGKLVARFNESCNGIDDDCDGRIDEGAGCYGAGEICVDQSDCGLDDGGVSPWLCTENDETGLRTCGGGLAEEDCTGTIDTNGDTLVGCMDPTCADDPACPDATCVDGNLGSTLSILEGDALRSGTVTSVNVSDFTLPAGEQLCGSRMQGSDRAYLFTALVAGEYTFSSEGTEFDAALILVRGQCPLDLATVPQGDVTCVDDNVGVSSTEELVANLAAGETVVIILDSALAPVFSLGRGDWALSIFKTPACQDGFEDTTDRYGNATEACDPGTAPSATCDTDCTLVACNDGELNPLAEDCEDGNLDDGDGCDSSCLAEEGFDCSSGTCVEVCGDSIIVAGGLETCDDGDALGGDGCSSACLVEAGWTCALVGEPCSEVCGDGVTVGFEVCDSPAAFGCDACLSVIPGYWCPPGGGSCVDIDECGEGLDECSLDGVCTNFPGSYSCSCLPGYEGDGFICVDINECLAGNGGCDANAQCTNTPGARSCACLAGWSGDGLVCNDNNECLVDNGGCDPLVACVNLPGGSTCADCPPGYSGTGDTACVPMECADPGAPANGVQVGVYPSFVLGTEVTVACVSGYEPVGGVLTRECEPAGPGVAFSGAWASCDRVVCPTPSAPANSTLADTPRTYRFQDVASFSCNAGYVITGGPSITRECLADRTFAAATATCERRNCGALSAPANGAVSTPSGTLFEATASYTCDSGYRLVGNASRTCGDTGAWSGTNPTCERITCTPPSPLANSTLTGGPYSYVSGEALNYACNAGYQATGSLARTCGLDGQYTAAAGSCERISCGPLSAPSNGTISAGDTLFETVRTFTCNTGYVASGSASRTCQSGGTWSGTAFSCTIFDCGTAPSPANGTITAQTGTTYNSTVSYACNSGYERIAGDTGLTCSPSGWVGIVPTCERVTCPSVTTGPQAPANATIIGGGAGPHRFGDNVTFECNPGYLLTGGDATRTCQASATWSGSIPVCTRISCPNPGVPGNGTVSSGNGGSPTYDYGQALTFACNPGFDLAGSATMTCGEGDVSNGRWNNVLPSCTAGICAGLPTVSNSTVSPVSATYTVGQTVTFTCDTGYNLSTPTNTLTCNTSRVWAGTTPVCSPVSCGAPSTPAGQVQTGAGYTYTFSETVTRACSPGWVRSGGTSDADLGTTCGATGTWSTPAATCVRVSCGAVPSGGTAPTNSTFASSTGTTFESTATYTCNSGYTRFGASTTVMCTSAGTWSSPSIACAPVDCSTPPTAGSNSVFTSAPTTTFGGTATYTCNTGSTTTAAVGGGTTYTRTCGPTGSWSAASGSCSPINCGTLSATAPLSVGTAPNTLFGATATYTCASGTRLNGSATRTCGVGGWSGSAPTCQALTCNAPTPVTGGTVTPTTGGRPIGSTVAHACNSATGYVQTAGTTGQTCADDGVPASTTGVWNWSGAALQCQLRECPTFDIANATETVTTSVGPNGRSVGSVVQFSCAAGYVVAPSTSGVSGTSRTCGTDGNWTGGLPSCVPRACAAVPAPPGNTSSATPAYTYPGGSSTPVSGTIATYTCAPGNRVGGSPTGALSLQTSCGNDGSWSALAGTCQPVNCGTPPASGLNASLQSGWTGAAGTAATYACTPGYSINDLPSGAKNYQATCQDGVGWVLPADTSCGQFQCDALGAVTGATLTYQTPGGATTTSRVYLNRAFYDRTRGYRLDAGNAERICQADGTWSGTQPVFTRMQCPLISTTAAGGAPSLQVTYSAGSTARWVDTTATFGCSSGWSVSAPTMQTCRETSLTSVEWQVPSWSAASTPVCVDVNECTSGSPPNCGANALCDNTAGSYACRCNTANGWHGATVTSGPATCSPQCGDGLTRGSEVCDQGTMNGVDPNTCEGTSCDSVPVCVSCSSTRSAARRCTDNSDNDSDSFQDCTDPACSGIENCPTWTCGGAINEYLPRWTGTLTGRSTSGQAYNYQTPWSTRTADYAFLWTAPSSGTYTISTCGSSFDTTLSLFSNIQCSRPGGGNYAGGTTGLVLAENDDACGVSSSTTVTVAEGEAITVVVSGYSEGSVGAFTLNVTPSTTATCGNGAVDQIGQGLSSLRVPDSRMATSSDWDTNHAGRFGRVGSNRDPNWSAGANNVDQWLRTDFGVPVTIRAVGTQGRFACCAQWVTQYRVEYSNDANVLTSTNPALWTAVGGGTIFSGNGDNGSLVVNSMPAPITARFWRIRPTGWLGHISMRAEFYSNYESCDDGNTTVESCAYGLSSCTVCGSSCTSVPGNYTGRCGDGTRQAAFEGCDDGNTVTESCAYGQTSCTVCNSSCQNQAGALVGRCGDGVRQATWESCDDGGRNGTPGYCNTSCNGTVACPGGYVADCNGRCGNAGFPGDGACQNGSGNLNPWGDAADFYCDQNGQYTRFPTEVCRCNAGIAPSACGSYYWYRERWSYGCGFLGWSTCYDCRDWYLDNCGCGVATASGVFGC